MVYDEEQIQLRRFFNQLIAGYHRTIQEKNLSLILEGPNDIIFQTKMELFYPVIKNLIENAIHYSIPNGKILIHYTNQNGLLIAIQDFGIGISQSDLERIFERFYRVDKARTRNTGGSGIGLAIVKDYVERLGGTIHVESHLGIGTTFTIHLPNPKGTH